MDTMDVLILIGGALVVLVIGLGAGYLLQRKMTAERSRLAEQKAREAVEEAKREAEAVRKEAEIQAKDHFSGPARSLSRRPRSAGRSS